MIDLNYVFRSIVNTMHEGIWVINENLNTVYVNNSMSKMLGFLPEDMIEKKITDLISSEDVSKMVENAKKTNDLKNTSDYKLKCKDGRTIWATISVASMRNDNNKFFGIIAVVTNIESKKELEKQSKDTMVLYDTLCNIVPSGIAVYTSSGKCIMANKSAADILGVTVKDLIGENFKTIQSWQKTGLLDYAEKTLFDGNARSLTVHMSTTFGKDVWISCYLSRFDYKGEYNLFLAFDDITKQKVAEREYENIKKQTDFILGATNTGLDIIDDKYNIKYVNPEWAKMYGDYKNKKCYDYFMGAYVPCPECGVKKALQEKRIIVTEEKLVKENNRPIEVTTIPFQDHDGNWLAAEINVDISRRKEYENKLRSITRALEYASEGCLVADINGMITYANESASQIFDYSKEDLMCMNLMQIGSSSNETAKVIDAMKFQTNWSGKIKAVRRNGELFDAYLSASIVYDEKREPVSIMCILKDLSGISDLEKEISGYKEYIDKKINDRMKGLLKSNVETEEFAKIVSEDLKGLLNVITNYVQLLGDKTK